MTITFVALSRTDPTGGSIAVYEFANAMRRRGNDVHVVHLPLDTRLRGLDDIEWFQFEEGIHHLFVKVRYENGVPTAYEPYELPDADFVCNYQTEPASRSGLPFVLLQGLRVWPEEAEHRAFHAPCPKICVAKWLVDTGRERGVPEHQLVHIPCGLKHDKYRVVTPIEDRRSQVAMLYRPAEGKGAALGFEAIARAAESFPKLRGVAFGNTDPVHEVPSMVTYLKLPDQKVIVNDIYNRSRIFVNPSLAEGFGLPSVEAMACGCALVTFSNGGSEDFAVDGETALVSEPGDVGKMVADIESLLRDDQLRVRLARRGNEYVKRFDWDVSAGRLEDFLAEYATRPAYYQQPAVEREMGAGGFEPPTSRV